MTLGIGLVLAILLLAIVLFVTEKVRVDVVALMVLVALVLTGVLGFEEAFAGFSNEGVITVASVLVLSAAFGSLLGGMTTLIGTAPNILISGMMHEHGLAPFELFDFSPVGYAVLASGILYMVTVGRRLLPARRARENHESVSPDSLGGLYGLPGVLFSVSLPEESWLAGRSLAESRPGNALGITVVAVRRQDRRILDPSPSFRLEGGDRLLLSGRDELLRALQTWQRLDVTDASVKLDEILAPGMCFAEVVLGKEAGATLADLDLRSRFGLTVLGIEHDRQVRLTESGYRLQRRLKEVYVPPGSELDGTPLADTHLGEAFGLDVLAIWHGDRVYPATASGHAAAFQESP